MQMNARVKAMWVAALRSGEYRQGAGVLFDAEKGEHCCWGVLCDVYDAKRWAADGSFMGERGFPPGPVLDWAGFTKKLDEWGNLTPQLKIKGVTRALTGHNDEIRWSFTELADAIEAQL